MSDSNSLTISVRNLKALVEPVTPCAGADDMLPVLNCVQIKTNGEWLVASATDRFRLAAHRQRGEWPAGWQALIPVRTLRGIFATFKAGRGSDPELTLTIVDDHNLKVEMTGGLNDGLFSEASITYPLLSGEFPNLGQILSKAIAAESVAGDRRFNWKFLSGFSAADPHGQGLIMHGGDPSAPMLVTDGEDFVGILMPRRLVASEDGATSLDLSSWTDILGDPVAPKAPAAKKTAKKMAGATA